MTPWVQFPKLEEKGEKGKEQQMGNLKVCVPLAFLSDSTKVEHKLRPQF